MDRRYVQFDPFIIAHNVRQVYYVPYPTTRRDKRDWCVAIKTKPRGRIDFNGVEVEVSYQVDEMSHVNEVIEVEQVSGLQDLEVELEEVDIKNVSSFEDQIDEETNEWEEDNEKGESEDEYGYDFDIFSSE